MSMQEPQLAWTLLLRPRGGSLAVVPAWPSLVFDRFGAVSLGPLPPVQQVLEGPLPVQVLSRSNSEQERWVLSGLGRSLGITVVVTHEGPVDRFVPVEELRQRAVHAFVGGDGQGENELESRLREVIDGEESWEFLGLIEVVSSLVEGAAPDLPEENGWDDLSGLVVGRGAGIGLEHGAWQMSGWYSGATDRGVMSRRLQVLLEGHLKRPSALLCFGAEAVLWGTVVSDASRRAAALEAVLGEVRLAASWAISGGPAVELDADGHIALSARLETLRVALEEDVQRLRSCSLRLRGPTQRIFGGAGVASPSGAFMEASTRSDDLLAEFAGRLKVAARWSEALELAGKMIQQRSSGAAAD